MKKLTRSVWLHTCFIFLLLWMGEEGLLQATPRIFVNIYVKGLRTDLLEYYLPQMSGDGFQLLLGRGYWSPDVRYDYPLFDPVSVIATLSSGAMPEVHGVSSGVVYDAENKTQRSIFYNPRYHGINSSEQLSPQGVIQTDLLVDVVRQEYHGASIVYAFASDANEALVLGGYDSESALWLDSSTGVWATSNFYGGLPALALRANNEGRTILGRYRRGEHWSPLLRAKQIPEELQSQPRFDYSFGGAWGMSDIMSSPLVNEVLVGLASDYIKYAHRMDRSAPTMINMMLDLSMRRQGRPFSGHSLEILDAYVRLDRELATILSLLKSLYGDRGYMVSVTGVPTSLLSQEEVATRREQVNFDPERCIALANLYLSAIYGRNDWVVGYHQHVLHMNKQAIERNKINLYEISNTLAIFVGEMKGILGAIPTHQLRLNKEVPLWASMLRPLSLSAYAGDVLLALSPSTTVVGDPLGNMLRSYTKVSTPFMLYGPMVRSERSSKVIRACDIAPTQAYLLGVHYPISAYGSPRFDILVPAQPQ